MKKYRVKIILTEGEAIESVVRGNSEEEIRSSLMNISDFREFVGDSHIMTLDIHEEI